MLGVAGGVYSRYYDDDHPENHYCAMEFRCYLDDSAKGFTYTLHDDC